MTEFEDEKPTEGLGSFPSWYAEIFPAGARDGFYTKVGDYSYSFVKRSDTQLVVSFDNLSDAGNPRFDREPWAGKFCRDMGWSHLGVYTQRPHWFRDQGLIDSLEALRDNGFFEQFPNVAFCGTSMGGFAAMTFSSLSPGANVVAYSPQSTLNSDLVPWETRFRKGRAADWSLPYSDAADQTAEARNAYVIFDPFHALDQKQVERFSGDNIQFRRAFGLGHKSAFSLNRLKFLKGTMELGIRGELDEATFYKGIRKRSELYLYRKNMEDYLAANGQGTRAERVRAAFKRKRKLMAVNAQQEKAGS